MGDRRGDSVWEHGENQYSEFACKYCKETKKGGGATRFKQHLAGRGSNVVHCNNVPTDVRDYYCRELDRAHTRKKDRQQESLRREEIAAEGNINDDDDEELQCALHMSREEEAYAKRVRDQGGQYEHGGSSQSQAQGSGGGGLMGMLRRATSRKGKCVKEATVQTRIDTGPWKGNLSH